MKRTALLASILALSIVFVACGSETETRAGSPDPAESPVSDAPDDPVTSAPLPDGDPGDTEPGRPQRVRPRSGMADLRQVGYETARQTPSGRSLRITYWSGVEPCNVLDHVDVSYDAEKITVTLFEGHDPDADDVACIEIALRKVVRVPLEEPVDGRKIVDGART